MTKQPAAPKLCVVTAAAIEFKTVAKLLRETAPVTSAEFTLWRGWFGPCEVELLKSEIGAPGFATQLQRHLAANRYDALLVIGLAGALHPNLQTGDVIIYDRCLDARAAETSQRNDSGINNRENSPSCDEFASIRCNARLGEQLFEAVQLAGLPVQRGVGALVERVIIEARLKAALHQQTQAAAVDMESWLVLTAVAQVNPLPCGALRVVLDEAVSDLPDFNAGINAAGQMRLWPTLRALAARPHVSARFLKSLRPALRNLEGATLAVFNHFSSRNKV
jgi:nucleoside phosphorylase